MNRCAAVVRAVAFYMNIGYNIKRIFMEMTV